MAPQWGLICNFLCGFLFWQHFSTKSKAERTTTFALLHTEEHTPLPGPRAADQLGWNHTAFQLWEQNDTVPKPGARGVHIPLPPDLPLGVDDGVKNPWGSQQGSPCWSPCELELGKVTTRLPTSPPPSPTTPSTRTTTRHCKRAMIHTVLHSFRRRRMFLWKIILLHDGLSLWIWNPQVWKGRPTVLSPM